MHAHSIVYQMGMHVSQRKLEASDYMDVMHPLLDGPHRDKHFILNMDRTPVYFAVNMKRTL
jgi:hypothetical protein